MTFFKRFLVLNLCWLLAFQSAGAVTCQVATAKAAAFDIAVTKRWDVELVQSYSAPGLSSRKLEVFLERVWPKPKQNTQQKAREYFFRTRETILREMRKIQNEIKLTGHENVSPMDLLVRIQNAIRRNHVVEGFTAQLVEKDLQKFEVATQEAIARSGAAQVPFGFIKSGLADFQKHVEGFRQKYGAEFFPEDVVTKAGFDVFAMLMLARLADRPIHSLESVYALSLLHPITDNALDSKQYDVSKSMGKITKLLAGEKPIAENKYEVLVFDMINRLLADFPVTEDRVVADTLQALHQEQLLSVKIQAQGQEAAVIENTLRKGALTYLLFARLGLGPMNEKQQKHFYKAGAILQLIDDFLDVKADLKENKATPWTLAAQKNRGDLSEPLLRMMKMLDELKSSAPEMLAGFPNQAQLSNSFDFAIRLFMISGTLDSTVYHGTKKYLSPRIPMDVEAMKTVAYSLLNEMQANPGTEAFFLKVLDMGFLNGQHAIDSQNQTQMQSLTNLAGGASPRWWAIRATQKLHDRFSDLWNAPHGSSKAETLTMIGALFSLSHVMVVANNLGGTPYAALVIPTYVGLAWSMKLRKPFYTLGLAMAFLAASFAVPMGM